MLRLRVLAKKELLELIFVRSRSDKLRGCHYSKQLR